MKVLDKSPSSIMQAFSAGLNKSEMGTALSEMMKRGDVNGDDLKAAEEKFAGFDDVFQDKMCPLTLTEQKRVDYALKMNQMFMELMDSNEPGSNKVAGEFLGLVQNLLHNEDSI